MFTAQVTSADNALNVPSNEGVRMDGPFSFYLANTAGASPTFAGQLQMKTGFGNWVIIPDANSRTTLTGNTAFIVDLAAGMYRVAVSNIVGTWDIGLGELP